MISTRVLGQPVDTVLFDLAGTTVDDGFIRHAIVQAASDLQERWDIAAETTRSSFIPTFMAVSAEYSDRPFYLLRDVVCTTLGRIVGVAAGHSRIAGAAADCVYGELLEIERRMWEASIPRASAVPGAVETISALRDAGLRTGLVSYSDAWLFHGLLDQSGLAGLTDVEVCSEQARSCKPHPAIFERALTTLQVAPANTLFVGDSVEQDIVGANRVGMSTALVGGAEFTISGDDLARGPTEPDHRISRLPELLTDTETFRLVSSGVGRSRGSAVSMT